MKTIYFLILFTIFSCNNPYNKPSKNKQLAIGATSASAINYDSCKRQIHLIKQQNRAVWKNMPVAKKEKIFTHAVIQTIIPAWIGTAWDFNGTTQQPQKGSIACGYFVTTVLQDAGLPIDRVRLAQCASGQMIKELALPGQIKYFSNKPVEIFVQAVQQQGYGLYIVGLDNHTGFIYNDGTEVYFIHSTFVGTRNVQQEPALKSLVLKESKFKMLGKISNGQALMDKWMGY